MACAGSGVPGKARRRRRTGSVRQGGGTQPRGVGGKQDTASCFAGRPRGLSVRRRCGMRRQRRSWQGPPTKAYRERTSRRRNAATGRRWQAGHSKLFCRQTTWSVCETAVWHAPAAAFLARPADEGVPGAYVKEAKRSHGASPALPGHAKLSCRQTTAVSLRRVGTITAERTYRIVHDGRP